MKIEIDFRPTDAPEQTLYADLPATEVAQIEAITTDPACAHEILTIACRITKSGPVGKEFIRAGRATIRRV